uniref:C-type lectin domain-containing protein n=1 Tax=Periophthalmus magnuspinnatus TaxID=409849 RepID=A0A3B3ZFQ3_9GOBI
MVRHFTLLLWTDENSEKDAKFKSVKTYIFIFSLYTLINIALNWTEAQQYCRQHYTDLATFWSLGDVHRVERPSGYGGYAWFGLFDDPASWKGVMGNDSNSWRWSATGNTNPGRYQNWELGQPEYYKGIHQCVTVLNGYWYDSHCISLCRVSKCRVNQ